MRRILTLRQKDITGASDEPINRDSFFRRVSVRAVIRDATSSHIPLMHSVKRKYYKLPGGGVDAEETPQQALEREALEETGCVIKITSEIGEAIEYRDYTKMIQTSMCYLAEGSIAGAPQPTDDEIAEQFEVVWAKDIAEAKRLISSAEPEEDDLQLRFMIVRDIAILDAATKLEGGRKQ